MGDDNGTGTVGTIDPVPPLPPGDPGAGHGEDDRDEDDVGYTPPLPLEDRLWRHPSEVASGRVAAPSRRVRRPDRRTASLMLASGLAGATLAVGVVAALGGFDERVVERQVVARTAEIGETPAVDAVASELAPSVAALVVRRGADATRASAVVLRRDGYLVTDGPAVAGADEIEVILRGGSAGVARLVGLDDVTGLAVLHLGVELERARLGGNDDALAVGARAVAVGARLDGTDWEPTATSGVVSGVGRRLESATGTRHGMILVDEPFAPGTAGGALVDGSGVVVGIVSGNSVTLDGTSHGVATPIDLVRRVADQLVEAGQANHVWLGLRGSDLDPGEEMAMALAGGALVEEVDERGPAGRAGIAPGDVVVTVDGEPTPTMSALIAALRTHLPGDVVALGVHRAGETRTVRVTLDAKA